jgi:hypothetical protein
VGWSLGLHPRNQPGSFPGGSTKEKEMKDNWTILQEKYNQYIGTLVIDGWDIVLFEKLVINVDDYYYQLYSPRIKEYYLSCVGDIIPLKGVLSEREYSGKVRVWNLCNILKKAK